jgi:hypothetical protein
VCRRGLSRQTPLLLSPFSSVSETRSTRPSHCSTRPSCVLLSLSESWRVRLSRVGGAGTGSDCLSKTADRGSARHAPHIQFVIASVGGRRARKGSSLKTGALPLPQSLEEAVLRSMDEVYHGGHSYQCQCCSGHIPTHCLPWPSQGLPGDERSQFICSSSSFW